LTEIQFYSTGTVTINGVKVSINDGHRWSIIDSAVVYTYKKMEKLTLGDPSCLLCKFFKSVLDESQSFCNLFLYILFLNLRLP
jgi:hypothetical protein